MKSLLKFLVWSTWTATLLFSPFDTALAKTKVKKVRSTSVKSVSAYYQQAQVLFRKGQVKEAMKVLRAIIKKYPSHTPSVVLYADILSSLGEYKRAASLYKKVGTRALTIDSAFNFGLAMYATKNCTLALKAFGRIPATSPNYYDGLFYSGVCQMRARRWDKAERLLSLAQNVSPQLRFSQRRLLDEARKRRRTEERGGSSSMQGYNIVAPPPLIYAAPMYAPYPASPYPQTIPGPPAPVAKTAVAPRAGFDLTGSVRGYGIFETDDNEYHGFKVNSFQVTTFGGGLNANARYNFKPSESGQGYMALNADVDFKKQTTSGSKLTNTISQDAPDQIKPETVEVAATDGSLGAFILKPIAEFPISNAWSLLGSFEYKKYLGDLQLLAAFPIYKQATTYTAQAGLNLSVEQVNSALTYYNVTELNDKGESIVNSHKFDASLRKSWPTFDIGIDANGKVSANVSPNSKIPLPSPSSQFGGAASTSIQFTDFRLGLVGSFSMLSMEQGVKLSSPDYGAEQIAKFELNINVPFPNDFNLGGAVSYALLSGYRLPNILGHSITPTTGETTSDANDIVATGGQMGAVITASYKPFEYVSLNASYKITSTEWAADKPSNQTKFEQEVVNLNKYLNIAATLSLNF